MSGDVGNAQPLGVPRALDLRQRARPGRRDRDRRQAAQADHAVEHEGRRPRRRAPRRREPGPGPRRAASGSWASAPASDECRRCRRTRPECEWSSRNRCLARAAPCRWRPRPPSRRTSRPGSSAGFHGLRVAPNSALLVLAPQANSGVLVLASTMAPAALRRRTTSASSAGTWSLNKRGREGGADARGRRDVLDRDRQAVQGAERLAVHDRRLRRARGIPRLLGGERDDRVELGVDALRSPRDGRRAPRPGSRRGCG